jgi:CRP-like cAMP-binding protein
LAGSNKILGAGQVLFKAGDKSDGMYLIRKGELAVYLEQDGKQVMLATIGEGGMIGEMALFDGAPRSASVKATKPTEVTLISTDDFSKLMKQIPKWFVGLMTALSTRLRQTNDRLKKLEGMSVTKGTPFQSVIRILNVLVLLWAKDGEKDGKDTVLQKSIAENTLVGLFNEDAEKVKQLFDVLVGEKLLSSRQDGYKNVVLVSPNRAVLGQLATFIQKFIATNPPRPCLPDNVLAMLRILEMITMSAPYDTTNVSLADLVKEGKREGLNTASWEQDIKLLQNIGSEEVRMVKTSNGIGLRTNKKEISGFVRYHQAIARMFKSNLA